MNMQQIQIFKDQAIVDMLAKVGLDIERIDPDKQAIYLRQTPEQEFMDSVGDLLDIMRAIPQDELEELYENSFPCKVAVRKLLTMCESLLEGSSERQALELC